MALALQNNFRNFAQKNGNFRKIGNFRFSDFSIFRKFQWKSWFSIFRFFENFSKISKFSKFSKKIFFQKFENFWPTFWNIFSDDLLSWTCSKNIFLSPKVEWISMSTQNISMSTQKFHGDLKILQQNFISQDILHLLNDIKQYVTILVQDFVL